MLSTLFFVLRLALAWFFSLSLIVIWSSETFRWSVPAELMLGIGALSGWVLLDAVAHVRRVRLLTGRGGGDVLSNRQRREFTVPLRGDDAFDELDAAIRALPAVEHLLSVKDSLQIRARLGRLDASESSRWHPLRWLGRSPTRLRAIVNPGPDDSSRITVSCEPMAGVLADLWFIDDAKNVENVEAIGRALGRRVAERKRAERNERAEAAALPTD